MGSFFQTSTTDGATSIGGSTPTTNTLLDVQSTIKASKPAPAMTTTQRNAIVSPSAGMTVFNTTTKTVDQYDGATWRPLFEQAHNSFFRSGRYYNGNSTSSSAGSVFLAANILRAQPFPVPRLTAFDRISIDVSAPSVGSSVRLGIYNDNGSGFPGSLVLDAGTVSSASIGTKEITIAQTLDAGMYWLGYVSNGAPLITARPFTGTYSPLGAGSPAGAIEFNIYTVAFVFAALPTPFPVGATPTTSNIPIFLRAT